MEQTQPTKLEKFKAFWIKANLQYLVLAFLLYGFKAGLYFIIAGIPTPRVAYFNIGDEYIPFIKYFYVFYLGYYFVPEIFIWVLSFFDKRKIFNLILGGAIVNIVCCTCFLIYQVQMQRPAVDLNMAWSDIHDFSSFFDRLIVFQYNADSTATNCYPSLHATFGGLLFLLGMPLSKEEVKKEHHFPIWCRIFCIIFGLGIVASTFFIKQHYWLDAVLGMALMVVMYYFAKALIDLYLENKKIEVKKDRVAANLFLGGLLINAIAAAICFTMFLFGILLASGAVTNAPISEFPESEIIPLGPKYMIGFGLAFLLSGAVLASYLYMKLAKKEMEPKYDGISMIVLGVFTVNPLYVTCGILKLKGLKDNPQVAA